MAFLSRFFSRAASAPLPSLEELLQARGIPRDMPGLEALVPDFEHHADAEGREAWVDALAELQAAGLPLPLPWVDAQYAVMPEIVPTWKGERDDRYYRPFVDGLCQRILVNGEAMPTPWLTLWGISEEEVLEQALELLGEASKNQPFQRLASGIYQSDFKDGNDAARLLVPELWRDLFPGQNVFVTVPVRQRLLVAPQVLLPKLVEAIEGCLGDTPNRLYATIYQVMGSDIMPANLQDPHPIAQPQRGLRMSDMLFAYKAQEEALDLSLGEAPAGGMFWTQQGRPFSYCFWKEGGPVLLPDTDMIIFLTGKGQPLGMFFQKTMPRIHELKPETIEIWGPRRLRYTGFPTEEQLSRLECAANAQQTLDLIKNMQGGGRPAPAKQQAAPPPPSRLDASPIPAHLRGLDLGVQSKED